MKHLKDHTTKEFALVAALHLGVIALSVYLIKKNNDVINSWAEEDPEYWNS